MWPIHNHAQPYGAPDEMAGSVPELRLKTAVADDTARMPVALHIPENEDLPLDTFYPFIFRLIKGPANKDTLVIYRPDSVSAHIWNEEVAGSLAKLLPNHQFRRHSNLE